MQGYHCVLYLFNVQPGNIYLKDIALVLGQLSQHAAGKLGLFIY